MKKVEQAKIEEESSEKIEWIMDEVEMEIKKSTKNTRSSNVRKHE